ncbi:hypothetical protein O5O45_19965 [Hahella aquimaris]|uniref:hypothetical protein n=1 Tax=Hahella sp. HNIBRBA332 TaxID=3015983 RepID=UPI00273AEDD3|nr:hypothetical protein [Hahella sp. HNIBRBA332]WLQ12007.1 hypothetical protein O5O45_19965 [Hahella sp. HNIBRBA332]
MNNPILTRNDLLGGRLAEIMSYYMLHQDTDRKDFLDIAQRQKGHFHDSAKETETLFGHPVPDEVIELAECLEAYHRHSDAILDTWVLEGEPLSRPQSTSPEVIAASLSDFEMILRLLTGMAMLGEDPSGDACFVNMLPSPLGTARVIIFDHECGEPSTEEYYSIADFIVNRWPEGPHISESGEEEEWVCKHSDAALHAIEDFNAFAEAEIKQRPFYHDPKQLFARTEWMHGHPSGEPIHAFAAKMDKAPAFDVYEQEKPLLTQEPALATYWMLAHFFLGNHNACRETINLVKHASALGAITQALAEALSKTLAALEQKTGSVRFGSLNRKKISNLITQTQANCAPEQLEPSLRAALLKARGETQTKRLTPKAFQEQIEKGADPLALIAEYPDDVAMHDLALKAIAAKDESFASIVKAYFSERTDYAHNEWPYSWRPDMLDSRLSLPIAAAFRSGLKFDVENKKAYPGITLTLGKYDDDNALSALEAAVLQLRPEDDRLEYVIQCLHSSKHPRRNEVLQKAAWRLFDILEVARRNEEALSQKRKKEGLTLSNMSDIQNHYLAAVHWVLKERMPAAEQIAEKILSFRDLPTLFKRAFGDALQVVGDLGLQQHTGFIADYVTRITHLDVNDANSFLREFTLVRYTEAVIAWTKLDPNAAIQAAKSLFERKTIAPYYDLDIKSGLLYPLLKDDPQNAHWREWTRRLLGNRNNNPRTYGPLRATAELKLTDFEADIRYNIYSEASIFDIAHAIIKEAARDALYALGVAPEALPKFDDEDEYATDVEPEDLPDAFKHPEKYLAESVCERIIKEEYRHPEAIAALSAYLKEMLQYSIDEKGSLKVWNGLLALRIQGVGALPAFAELLELPHIKPSQMTKTLYLMRTIEPEADIRHWLYQATEAEILTQLHNVEPRFMHWLDLLAARAWTLGGDKPATISALCAATEFRTRGLPGGKQCNEEPTLRRLPRILAIANTSQSLDCLQRLDQIARSGHEYSDYKPLDLEALAISREQLPPLHAISVSLEETICLQQSMRDEVNGPFHHLNLKVSHTSVLFECSLTGLHLHGAPQESESRAQIDCASEAEAIHLAKSIILESLILGYHIKAK